MLWNGQTPGKRALRIRVIQDNGLPLTTNATLTRNLVRLFDYFPALYAVGLVVMFATKHTQRLGDLAARTVVVREQRTVDISSLHENWRVYYHFIIPTAPLPPYIQLDQLTEADRRTIVDFLQRRDKNASP